MNRQLTLAIVITSASLLGKYAFATANETSAKTNMNVESLRQFANHFVDSETKLIYAQQRYYLPEIGAFTTADPLFIGSPDFCLDRSNECELFSYVANNPVNLTDPTGTTILQKLGRLFKPSPLKMRKVTQSLYRFDTRAPSIVMREGFGKGTGMPLKEMNSKQLKSYVQKNDNPFDAVSTSLDLQGALKVMEMYKSIKGFNGGFIYKIKAEGLQGIDPVFEGVRDHEAQNEFIVDKQISGDLIEEVQQVDKEGNITTLSLQ